MKEECLSENYNEVHRNKKTNSNSALYCNGKANIMLCIHKTNKIHTRKEQKNHINIYK